MDLSASDRAQVVIDWLLRDGRHALDRQQLLQAFCEKLIEVGVPLARATTHARTLHPQFRWFTHLWRRGSAAEESRRPHSGADLLAVPSNVVRYVLDNDQWLDCRLDDPMAERFPLLGRLQREGYTHFIMAPFRFSNYGVGAASWTTDAPEGFAAEQVLLLRQVADAFFAVFEAKGLRRVLSELLATYVGHDPARYILEGTVQRGDVRRLRAAIMLTDLRGFGHLSDTLPAERVVKLLNEHFDCIVPQVLAEGGEVLKFIGDGVLAVFDQHQAEKMPSDAAYRAARAALAALAARNRAGGFDGIQLRIGIALHCGEVAYGNIGSEDRLDFTTIGRDVNIASRLERLCEPMDRTLLMTGEFVSDLTAPTVELGHFVFKGFKQHEAVYGIADEGD
jgi:adenylate cyclase